MFPWPLLRYVPKSALSYWVGRAVHFRWPLGIQKALIRIFIKIFQVDCETAEKPLPEYITLGDFFSRRLKPDARPIGSGRLISPVDGTAIYFGTAEGRAMVVPQVKGKNYRLADLLGKAAPDQWPEEVWALTLYLAPPDYHRVHSPLDGILKSITYIPGRLWPVNTWSVKTVDGLFTVNERVVFELESQGEKVYLVMVGATNVGGITSPFLPGFRGNPRGGGRPAQWNDINADLARGREVGCFNMGSTVILVGGTATLPLPASRWKLPRVLRMGESLWE